MTSADVDVESTESDGPENIGIDVVIASLSSLEHEVRLIPVVGLGRHLVFSARWVSISLTIENAT